MTSSAKTAAFSLRFSAFALLALPLAIGSVGCSKPAASATAPAAMPPMKVGLLVAKSTSAPEIIEVVARAEGAKTVEVRARVTGILKKIAFDEGQSVKAGQVLFEIERDPYEIVLKQAKAQLAQADAQSAQAMAAKAAAEAQVAQAQSALDEAKREDVRLQGLVKDQAVSQREADQAKTAAQSAEAALLSAQAGIQNAVAAGALAEAAKQTAQAQISDAELNLSYCSVTAPVDGVTGNAIPSEGALISPANNGLLTNLSQNDPIWVTFGLSEADLARIPGGKDAKSAVTKVRALLPGGEYAQDGKLNFGASVFDPQLGTLALRATFPNPESALLPGQFMRVRVNVGERAGVFLLPQTAIQNDTGGRYVFLRNDKGAAERRAVEVGAWQGENWVVLKGLKDGDQVVLDSQFKIGMMMGMMPPGTPIMLAPADGAAPAPKADAPKDAPKTEGAAK